MVFERTGVVVIGGGIAGLACAHRLMGLGVDVVLLESSPRVGGKIETVCRRGVEFEAGPSTLIANRQPMLDLIAEAGLNGEVIDAAPAARKRWISLNGRLCTLPRSPLAALVSPLLGPGALARALGDLLLGRPSDPPTDESVASFVERRFGKRVLENLVSPFLSGVYAGDVTRLEARSILPSLVLAEEARGSVIRGLITERRAARRTGTPKLPMRSITFRGGLETLPRRIGELLGDRVRLGSRAEQIVEVEDGCRVTVAGGDAIACERVVIAAGAPIAADLVGHLPDAAPLAAGLRNAPCAGLATVGLVYQRSAVKHPLDGFGYLNGPGSKGPVLGCLFRSSVFPHSTPPDKVLLSAFIGGALHPGCAEMDEDALVLLARRELEAKAGARGLPEDVFVRRWPGAIPQYNRGHSALRAMAERWSGQVSIVGSALTGVSLNDCVTAGRAQAERLASGLDRPGRRDNKKVALCPSA